MGTRYVRSKTSRLYTGAQGGTYVMVLIAGDEVETTGPATDGRVPVVFRGRPGFMAADQLGPDPMLEVYFIDVGQGDSTFIVTPGRKTILIDGGLNRRAMGFLAWKYRLDLDDADPLVIDLLLVSHGDEDHLKGLTPLLAHPKIDVKRIVHSGIARYASGLDTPLGDVDDSTQYLITRHNGIQDLDGEHLSRAFTDWVAAVKAEPGVSYEAVDASTGQLDFPDPSVELEVLGPRLVPHPDDPGTQVLPRLGGKDALTINGHSVVLRLTHGQVRMLFPGDLNIQGAAHLLEDPALADRMDAHVLKAPHHGSHEFEVPFLEAVRPQIAVISSGDEPDHGHPRANYIGAAGRCSRSDAPLVFATEIAATFLDTTIPAPGDAGSGAGEAVTPGPDSPPDTMEAARRLFKRRLHGMINVRSDGQHLYAARRVAASYWWEAYGPVPAVELG